MRRALVNGRRTTPTRETKLTRKVASRPKPQASPGDTSHEARASLDGDERRRGSGQFVVKVLIRAVDQHEDGGIGHRLRSLPGRWSYE